MTAQVPLADPRPPEAELSRASGWTCGPTTVPPVGRAD